MIDSSLDCSIKVLAGSLAESQRPVFITGAGLSVASGLSAYRSGPDAVWDKFVTEWGTRERFEEQPLAWWKDFWLRAHPPADIAQAKPNAGHMALARVLDGLPKALLVTQNVDGLHRAAGTDSERLIEIHGRSGLYRCVSGRCRHFEELIEKVDLSQLEQGEVPRCPLCSEMLRPLVLLFDELYLSHPFFQGERAFQALEEADLFVFVGTSFSVGITNSAAAEVMRRKVPAFSINIEATGVFADLLGASEIVLPALVAAM